MEITDKILFGKDNVKLDSSIKIAKFNKQDILRKTTLSPEWLHIGASNIFRAYPSILHQELLERNLTESGIIVAEGYDYEIIDKIFMPFDNNTLVTIFDAEGTLREEVSSSIVESLKLDRNQREDFNRLTSIFRNPSLKMVTFTITEKGYQIFDRNEDFILELKNDFDREFINSEAFFSKLVYLLYERYKHSGAPIALVSLDNCSNNGDLLMKSVLTVSNEWSKRGYLDKGFIEYVNNNKIVTFPLTMIDKITPRPDENLEEHFKMKGLSNISPIRTAKGSYIAPYVNSEEIGYLIIEDNFPNGKIPLDEVGAIFTERSTVKKMEKMKVSTCLNPLHTALAIMGCLLSYDTISSMMENEDIVEVISILGYCEGLPVVTDPKIVNPKNFLKEVIEIRLPNPFINDSPFRIATDTSQKLKIRFGNTLDSYMKNDQLSTSDLKIIPFIIAAWFRYLMGIDDQGNKFIPSNDPLLDDLKPIVSKLKLGENNDVENIIGEVLHNEEIFGVDLYEANIANLVVNNLELMLEGNGAIEKRIKDLAHYEVNP